MKEFNMEEAFLMNRIMYNLVKKKGSLLDFDTWVSKLMILSEGKFIQRAELYLELISNDSSNRTSWLDLEMALGAIAQIRDVSNWVSLSDIMLKIFRDQTKPDALNSEIIETLKNNTMVKDFMAHVVQMTQAEVHEEERF